MASLLRMIPYRWPELPDPAPPAGADAVLYGQLAGILRQQSLQPHFQPIIHLGSGDLLWLARFKELHLSDEEARALLAAFKFPFKG